MDFLDEQYLNGLIQDYRDNIEIDDSILTDIKNLYIQALEENIYRYYIPKIYNRTRQLIKSVSVKIQNGEVIIYNDYKKTHYHSNVSQEEVSAYVTYWIENGHDDGIGNKMKGYNQYHRYEDRRFLEKAKELIKNKYPELDVKIINDKIKYIW